MILNGSRSDRGFHIGLHNICYQTFNIVRNLGGSGQGLIPHSYRKATIGSTLDALLAGI